MLQFGCGQCMPCRINRRRLWTHRMMLESLSHSHSCFVTLTYAPYIGPPPVLQKRHIQLFLKRLRERFGKKLRYYIAGEYGDRRWRAHYHAALFGISLEQFRDVAECWNYGHVHIGTLTKDSAQYVAGYVTKKMTRVDDPRLKGRPPEFCMMSTHPGIGAGVVKKIADKIIKFIGDGDVPMVLTHGKKNFPLGRYLRQKLREECNIDVEKVKSRASLESSKELCMKIESALKIPANAQKSIAKISVEMNQGKINYIEGRHKMSKVRDI